MICPHRESPHTVVGVGSPTPPPGQTDASPDSPTLAPQASGGISPAPPVRTLTLRVPRPRLPKLALPIALVRTDDDGRSGRAGRPGSDSGRGLARLTVIPAVAMIAWLVPGLPLLLAGSLMFWTMALGSGAVSLLAVTGLAGSCTVAHGRVLLDQSGDQTADTPEADDEIAATAAEPMPGSLPPTRERSILVHLQESAEPEDVNDNPGAVVPVESEPSEDDGTGQLPARPR